MFFVKILNIFIYILMFLQHGTYSYKYYNFNTHNDEFGKMVVEEYKP